MKEAQARTGMPEISLGGMGLLNVYLRWKFYCPEESVFECGNTADGHGRVLIGRFMKED